MELQGQDLTNLPVGISLPRPKLPIFTYHHQQQQEHHQQREPLMQLQINSSQQQPPYLFQTAQASLEMIPSQSVQPTVICQQLGHLSSSDDDSGFDIMDDSLTDMQWLQRMDAAGVPGMTKGGRKRARGADKENKRSASKDGSCRKKLDYSTGKKSSSSNKPPLSYASLIALAICSTPQRMMTLSGIYRWIENTFPFYRTPEAKAWKNSIRHNLSIRKNMFMKVYQYPPRRGNGSYWTLLPDGEEELKRAIPLFSTFRPPVIDSECVYSRGETTHTVKSKGQFVPLLPRNTLSSSGHAYFSVNGTLGSGMRLQSGEEELTTEVVLDSAHLDSDYGHNTQSSDTLPSHIAEHSYAKIWHVPVGGVLEEGASDGERDKSACPPTPKRKKSNKKSSSRRQVTVESVPRAANVEDEGDDCCTTESQDDDGGFQTPPKEQDSSLHLLDASLLTPLRSLDPDVELGPFSLSPLYTNFVTPKRSTDSTPPTSSESESSGPVSAHTPQSSSATSNTGPLTSSSSSQPSNTSLNLSLTPLRTFSAGTIGGVGGLDSGIFSPLSADTFNVKFSTPILNLSPLTDLLQPNTFSTPHPPEFLTPLKVLDSSNGSGNTPLRIGSLEALGLPGFTPPTSALKRSRR